MHPTIDLNFIHIPVYTALVALGAAAGLVTALFFLRAFSRRVYSPIVFLDGAIIVFASGWIGARVLHIATHWDYYTARPEQITQWEAGGLAMRGVLIGGFLGLVLYAQLRRLSSWRLADAAALGLALGQAIGWVGALVWGANYGAVSDSAIAVDLPNIYGIVEPRLPLQHAEIALYAILFFGLLAFSFRRPEKGQMLLIYLLVASLANFALGFFRGDESVFLGTLRFDQVLDAAFVIIAIFVLMLKSGLRVVARMKVVNAQ